MRLLLVQASHYLPNGQVFRPGCTPYPGLALPLLAALTPDNFEVEIVDDYHEDAELDRPCDLVGISAMTPQAPRAYSIADAFRRRGKKVVIGGFHASLMPEEAGEHADAVIIGEADESWPQAVEDFRQGRLKPLYKASGLADLSKLPTPRYELMRKYRHSLRVWPVQTTRGCPMDCEFCSVRQFFGRSYRHRPIEDVVRDIKATGSKYIFFVDDNIAANRSYALKVFRALKPLNLLWGCQCNVTVARDEELLREAASAGCFSMFVGIESINPESLESVHKVCNKVEEYRELLSRMVRAGISPMVSMIMGLDGDGPNVFERTYRFLMDLHVPLAYFFILTPAPGTQLFDRLRDAGRLRKHDWSRYGGDEAIIQPALMTPQELEEGYWQLYRRFYSLPSIIRRVLLPPRVSGTRLMAQLKYNLLHRASLRRGVHPLRG
jgi:radical SAM superfamily enzyme YgiQ (UPF0313 family)